MCFSTHISLSLGSRKKNTTSKQQAAFHRHDDDFQETISEYEFLTAAPPPTASAPPPMLLLLFQSEGSHPDMLLKKKKTCYYYSTRRSSSSDSSLKPAAGSMKESPEVATRTIAICESTTIIRIEKKWRYSWRTPEKKKIDPQIKTDVSLRSHPCAFESQKKDRNPWRTC